LGEASGEVEGVVRGQAIHGLPQSVAEAVVLVCQCPRRPGAIRCTLPLLGERGCVHRAHCIWAGRLRLWDENSEARRCVWLARSISPNWELLQGEARICV
jgi:hypothetical protein